MHQGHVPAIRDRGGTPALNAGGIDRRITYDNSGIWSRNVQLGLIDTMVVGEIAGALWEGGESRIGKTFRQPIDSSAAVAAQAGRRVLRASDDAGVVPLSSNDRMAVTLGV